MFGVSVSLVDFLFLKELKIFLVGLTIYQNGRAIPGFFSQRIGIIRFERNGSFSGEFVTRRDLDHENKY